MQISFTIHAAFYRGAPLALKPAANENGFAVFPDGDIAGLLAIDDTFVPAGLISFY